MAPESSRVVVGVVIQNGAAGVGAGAAKTFSDVEGTGFRIREGHTDLAQGDFGAVPSATAATVAEFTRDASGAWSFEPGLHGFDSDPEEFARIMGGAR